MVGQAEELSEMRPSGPGVTGGRKTGRLFRVTLALAVTLLVHAAAYFLFRVDLSRVPAEHLPSARLAWLGMGRSEADSILQEQLLLFDNAPLFLPTPWNASTAETTVPGQESASELFPSFPKHLVVDASRVPPMLEILPRGPDSPLAGLTELEFGYLGAWGRTDTTVVRLPARLAQIEVSEAFSGTPVARIDVEPAAAGARPDWPDWEPFEIRVDVDRAGWQAPPLVGRGSGVAAVDAFFRDHVRDRLHLNVEFGPGSYRLWVGP